MNEKKSNIDLNLVDEISPFFGQTLVRDVLIPNLLGSQTNEILYWAGKEMARQYPLCSIEDTILFFERAGFGNLELQKRDKHTIVYRLTGTFVESRLNVVDDLSFNLETGFLAEQIQQQESIYTEAFYELQPKKQAVTITLKQDTKEMESLEQIQSFYSLTKPNEALESVIISEGPVKESESTEVKEELKDSRLDETISIFDQLPSRTSKHLKKR